MNTLLVLISILAFVTVFAKPHLSPDYLENPEFDIYEEENELKSSDITNRAIDPDIIHDSFLLVPELITKYGYPAERHQLQTDDGYILEMHRIPGSPSSPPKEGKRPVFLMHGLLDSSSTWVIMGPQKGFAYMLADLGYDVWMGNARGNRYSRQHITNDPDGKRGNRRRFWEFSFHEIGTIDLPNMIDYVIRNTSLSRLHYIGHSQGTTAFFVMATERANYNNKIISMHALAPVAFMSRLKNPFLRAASTFLSSIDTATSMFGMYEFLPNDDMLGLFGQAACKDEAFLQDICANIIFLFSGFNSKQLNYTMIPVITGHTPAGASVDQLIHFGQEIKSGKFRQYDHGLIKNLVRYGKMSPPQYYLRNIRAPVALYYSRNDWLSDPKDVEQLHQALPNAIGSFLISNAQFNHLDFVWAIDVRSLVYDRVVTIMQIYEDKEKILNQIDNK